MELDLRDRVVVVTGAARGIGAAIAARFAEEGSRVVALDLAFPDEAAEGAPTVDQVVCDVADPDSVHRAVEAVVERHGTIDVLVNNAGIVADSTVVETDWATWQKCFDVNTGGTFLNIFWLIFFGWWLCLTHISTGIVQCISIIGIPVGLANFKIAAIALWPVGRRVVSVEEARAARDASARRRY